MKLTMYAIFDHVAKVYTQPFYAHNQGMAIRIFTDNVNAQEENHLTRHSEQFTLYKIGEYDDHEGKITPNDPDYVISGKDVREERSTPEIQQILAELKALININRGKN